MTPGGLSKPEHLGQQQVMLRRPRGRRCRLVPVTHSSGTSLARCREGRRRVALVWREHRRAGQPISPMLARRVLPSDDDVVITSAARRSPPTNAGPQ